MSETTAAASLLVDVERLGRDLIGDQGASVDASRVVGWLVSMHPFPLKATRDALQTLKNTSERWAAIERQGLGWGVLRYAESPPEELRLASQPEIRFNYLGDMLRPRGDAIESFRALATRCPGERAPDDLRTHLWELDFAIRDKSLTLEWTYSENRHHQQDIEELAYKLREALRLLGANPM